MAAVEGVEGVHVRVYLKNGFVGPSSAERLKRTSLFSKELHVWSLTQDKAIAALHLSVTSDSLTAFMKLSQKIQSCLHFWGIHAVTIQPELLERASTDSQAQPAGSDTREPDQASAVAGPNKKAMQTWTSQCRLRCPSQLCEAACC